MRSFVRSLNAGERFSALLILAAFLGITIPAAIDVIQNPTGASALHHHN
jgi:hypothetical protein